MNVGDLHKPELFTRSMLSLSTLVCIISGPAPILSPFPRSNPDTSGNIAGLPSARFSSMQWLLTPMSTLGAPGAALTVRVKLIVMPEAATDYIHGSSLWRVGLYLSGERDGGGVRHQYVRQILDDYETSRELTVSSPLIFDLITNFNMEGVGCGDKRYVCLEFAKGDRPRPNFNLPIVNNHFVECHLYRCRGECRLRTAILFAASRAIHFHENQSTFVTV